MAKKQDRPDVARRREQWRKYQGRIAADRLVFIDETWAKTNTAPLRGWSPRGARLKAKAPFGRWKTLTFIAALRRDRIDAPCLLDGPINGQIFLAWVRTFLVPTLQAGDVVVMDNLGSHRGKLVRQAIRQAGARLLFLPKYSPDLNPSSRSSPSSSTSCERLRLAHTIVCSRPPACSSTPSRQKNAPTISETQAMPPNLNTL